MKIRDDVNGPGKGARSVLVVEDNQDNSELLAYLLEWLGFRTDLAENGVEALAAIADREYAAVLMDCELPRMDGFEATSELRRREHSGRRTPVLAVTAHASRAVRDRCLAAGMDDCLTKPVGAEELRTALAAVVPSLGGPASPAADVDRHALADLAERIGADALAAVLETFWRETDKRLARLRDAIDAGDPQEVSRVAHAVKGAASSLAAGRLAEVANVLQAGADEGSLSAAEDLLDALQRAYVAAREAGADTLAEIRGPVAADGSFHHRRGAHRR